MKLYMHQMSHNCRKVRAVLIDLGMPCEQQEVDLLTGENRKPEFLRLNPNGKVPTLQDGSFVLWESNAIVGYLCEKAGNTTLWPADVQGRADMNRWLSWNNAHWQSAIDAIAFERLVKKMMNLGAPEETIVATALSAFHQYAAVLNNHLEGRDYLMGPNLTAADYVVAACLTYAVPSQIPLESYKRIQAWASRIEAREAWEKTAPPPMG